MKSLKKVKISLEYIVGRYNHYIDLLNETNRDLGNRNFEFYSESEMIEDAKRYEATCDALMDLINYAIKESEGK